MKIKELNEDGKRSAAFALYSEDIRRLRDCSLYRFKGEFAHLKYCISNSRYLSDEERDTLIVLLFAQLEKRVKPVRV